MVHDRTDTHLRGAWSTRALLLAVVALSIAAVVVSILSLEAIHPGLSWNRDEPVYLWQIGVLETGRLTAPVGDPVAAFRPWLSGIAADGYFSQYTLGWPLALLAADVVAGTPAAAVVAGTVLAVIGAVLLAREVTGRSDLAVLVGAAFLASPVVVLQAGVHLGYLFTVGLGNLALALAWSGLRVGSRIRLVGAGALLGWILLTRPFDAVLWGAVLVVGAVVRHRPSVVVRLWPTVVVGLPFVVAAIAYNLRITGEAFTFPIVATDPLDTFGLGERRLMPGFETTEYTVGLALSSTAKNAGFFVVFLAGNVVTGLLALAGAWWRRRQPETWMLVALGVAFPLGYFFFWGTQVSSLTARLVGSIYYVPAVVPFLVLGLLGALELRRRRRWLFAVAAVAVVVVTVPVLVNRIGVNHRISAAQQPWRESVRPLDEPSLVIVASSGNYLLFQNPYSSNEADLDDEVLYAVDLGPGNLDTIAAHAGHRPYLQVASAAAEELGPRETPIRPTVDLVPIEVATGDTVTIEATFTPLDDAPVVVPFVETVTGTAWGEAAEVTTGPDERSSMVFHLGRGGLALAEGRSVVRVGFGTGDSADEARRNPRIRWELSAEVTGEEITAMLPVQQFVRFAVGRDRKWYPRPNYPGAGVSVSVDG